MKQSLCSTFSQSVHTQRPWTGAGWEQGDRLAGAMSRGEPRKSSGESLWAFGGQGKGFISVWGWKNPTEQTIKSPVAEGRFQNALWVGCKLEYVAHRLMLSSLFPSNSTFTKDTSEEWGGSRFPPPSRRALLPSPVLRSSLFVGFPPGTCSHLFGAEEGTTRRHCRAGPWRSCRKLWESPMCTISSGPLAPYPEHPLKTLGASDTFPLFSTSMLLLPSSRLGEGPRPPPRPAPESACSLGTEWAAFR